MIAPTRRTLSVLTAAIACGVALQTACRRETEPTGPPDWGSGRIAISGAVTAEWSGPGAVLSQGPAWYVFLANAPESNSEWGLYFGWSASRPAAGATIPIGPTESDPVPLATHAVAEVYYLRRSDDRFFPWTADAGEIRILTSSRQRMSGTFELTAQPTVSNPLGSITVTGTFEAVCLARQGSC
jgi:hypothetical protein